MQTREHREVLRSELIERTGVRRSVDKRNGICDMGRSKGRTGEPAGGGVGARVYWRWGADSTQAKSDSIRTDQQEAAVLLEVGGGHKEIEGD